MEQQVFITTDLGYGDAGKGSMVDALVHHYDIPLVVRYSGGAQAAHNVVTPDGRHHTFAQFGSGTFRPNTKTYLGPKMLVQPSFLLKEATALAELGVIDPLSLLFIDRSAPVITPYHQLVNQLKELARGLGRHGSCGIGIGETRADSEDVQLEHLVIGDLLDPTLAQQKLEALREQKKQLVLPLLQAHIRNPDIIRTWHEFDDPELLRSTLASYEEVRTKVTITDSSVLSQTLTRGDKVIMEAAQGTLLDEDYGFFPYVTRGKVRTIHAHELLESIGYQERPYVLGITRAYAARHGPGPFPTENVWLRNQINELHNEHGQWQGAFRMGHFDAVATRYAMAVNGQIDGLAVTCLDQLPSEVNFYAALAYFPADAYNMMQDLPLPKAGDLEALAVRSEWLMREVSPIYSQVNPQTFSVPNAIAHFCKKEVVATSSGVTRESKQFFTTAVKRQAT